MGTMTHRARASSPPATPERSRDREETGELEEAVSRTAETKRSRSKERQRGELEEIAGRRGRGRASATSRPSEAAAIPHHHRSPLELLRPREPRR